MPGRFVVIYVPGDGSLALGDVKIYVRPVGEPGEPEGPGGPNGPDGPQEVDTTDQPTGGTGENPENGNDGNPDTCFSSDAEQTPWWSLDLGKEWDIVAVHVVACTDNRKFAR